jgi:hypothetical protein
MDINTDGILEFNDADAPILSDHQLRELEGTHRRRFGVEVVLRPVRGGLHVQVGVGRQSIEEFIPNTEIARHMFRFIFISAEVEKMGKKLCRPTAWQRLLVEPVV